MNSPGPRGLSTEEATRRLQKGLSNRTRPTEWIDYSLIASRHLFTLFNFIVCPTAIALFSFGDWRSGVSVTGTAIANTVIGLFQEWRAKRQLDQLAILTARKARVIRDGSCLDIPIDDVVQGDLVLLKAGETVVADGPLLEANYLEIDEALLTGESDPVRRHAGENVLSGSICLAGEGCYLAEKVGDQAFAQNVALDARRYRFTASPITRSANAIIFVLTVVTLLLCVFYFLLHWLGFIDLEKVFQMIAATIVSMVPQGLVLTATISFTLGAVEIGKLGALVQRLNAVEAMAAIDVLCTDKTGTLTSNRLQLNSIQVLAADHDEVRVRDRLALFVSGSLDQDNKNIQAILASVGQRTVEIIDQVPFNARHRYSALRVRFGETEHLLALGAPETLSAPGQSWRTDLELLQGRGMRVLLFAEITDWDIRDKPIIERTRAIALIALSDELRPDAAQVIQSLWAQGIAFKAISGDNPVTVHATIAPLALPLSEERVVTGEDFAQASDPIEFARKHSIFGRVEPRQKLAIISALQKGGANVAMIGDGVNDVLPIKRANLGIAMGEGSPAAKTVSSIVLENNRFSILPEAIAEGRTIVRNLKRAGKLFLTKNVYSLVFILVYAGGFLDLPFPYLPQQVSLLNWMTIGVPALLISFTLERSKFPDRTGYLSDVSSFALRTGLVAAIAGISLLALSKQVWELEVMEQRTMLLTFLILFGMTVLWRIFGGVDLALVRDQGFRALTLIILPIYALMMYWPLAADFFQLSPLGWTQWLKVALFVAVSHACALITDRLSRSPGERPSQFPADPQG